MTVQFRSHLGAWHIASTTSLTQGETISVTRRNGAASNVIVGALVAHDPDRDLPYLYAFSDARRAAGAVAADRHEQIENAARLFGLFERASAHHTAPAVRFTLSNTTRGLRLEMAGTSSRYAGRLLALSETRTSRGRRMMYGSMSRQGDFGGTVGATAIELEIFTEVASVLRNFAADPAGYSAQHGRASGACCYCGRGLTDPRSLEVGYGPICADHYGLPWGDVAPPAFDVRQGPVTQRERLADNAGQGNNFDEAENMTDIVRRELAESEARDGQSGTVYTRSDDELRRVILARMTAMARPTAAPDAVTAAIPNAAAPAGGVVTNTYRRPARPAAPAPATPRVSPLQRLRERAAARARAEGGLDRPTALGDETVTTVQRAVRRDPNTALEEDDFVWPPRAAT